MTRYLACNIKPGETNGETTVLDYLAHRFTYHSRDEWRGLVCAGRVLANSLPADPGLVATAGMRLDYFPDDSAEPPVDDAVQILGEYPGFLAVNKTGNLPCHPGGRYFNNTLWSLAKSKLNIATPFIINRLDRETSGVCLVARDPETAARLAKLFSSRLARKTYLAIVHGVFPETLEASGILESDPKSAVRKKLRFVQGGPAFCSTRFRRLACDGNFSQIEIEPLTGRTHQIRATLLGVGFPIVGDKLYGLDETLFLRHCDGALTADDLALLRLPRQALHAHTLDLPPDLHFCAPLPNEMQ